jgi:hypothetical protein
MKYTIKIKDPNGKKRRFKVYEDLPIQIYVRGKWQVTIEKIKRTNGIYCLPFDSILLLSVRE